MLRINLILMLQLCLNIVFYCKEIRIYPKHFKSKAKNRLDIQQYHIYIQPKMVLKFLDKREMIINHFLFHSLKNDRNSLDETTKKIISYVVREPPNDSLYANERTLRDNNSGEDFL